MDYEKELEKFFSLKTEINLVKSNISKRVLEVTQMVNDKEYRVDRARYLCNQYTELEPIKKVLSGKCEWYIAEGRCHVSWEEYRGGGEYDTLYQEFDVELLYSDTVLQKELSRLDQEARDILEKKRKEKEEYEKSQAQAEWDLYQKLSKKYSDNAEKLDVSQ